MKTTITEFIKRNSDEYPTDIAYIFDDTVYTWKDVEEASDAVAFYLMNQGLRKGMHVGIRGVNTYQWIICFYACAKLGAVSVLINAAYQTREAFQVMKYARLNYLLLGESRKGHDYLSAIKEIRSELPELRICYTMNQLWQSMTPLPVSFDRKELEVCKAAVDETDTLCMVFTSGTTRCPKGVLLSHGSILRNGAAIGDRMEWGRQDIMCLAMPLFHCSGLTACLLAGLHKGFSIVLLRSYKTIAVLAAIEKYRCTIFNAVPSMLLLMTEHLDFEKYDLSSLKSGTLAGSDVSDEKYTGICRKLNVQNICTAYGQTETSPIVTMTTPQDSLTLKRTTVGKVLPEIEMRIFCLKEKRVLPVGQIGEIQVKGYCNMQGYYDLPEDNAGKFEDDGWLKTSDLGFLDEAGYLHFQGRIGDMIIRGGENISPAEIEECIEKYSSHIMNVKVIGVKEGVLQEEIVAFYTADILVHEKELRNWLSDKLACYKVPKYYCQLKEFPMTGSGKIDKKALEQKWKQIQKKIVYKEEKINE